LRTFPGLSQQDVWSGRPPRAEDRGYPQDSGQRSRLSTPPTWTPVFIDHKAVLVWSPGLYKDVALYTKATLQYISKGIPEYCLQPGAFSMTLSRVRPWKFNFGLFCSLSNPSVVVFVSPPPPPFFLHSKVAKPPPCCDASNNEGLTKRLIF